MDAAALNERIARALGWDYVVTDNGREWRTHIGTLRRKTLDWSDDLNYLHDLVNTLDEDEIWQYHVNLLGMVSNTQSINDPRRLTIEELRAFMEPTAQQKAEAWLKVKEVKHGPTE